MENLTQYISENVFNVNDDSIMYFNMMKLSKSLKNILSLDFNFESPIKVYIDFFKKIYKNNVIARLILTNEKNQKVVLNYNYNTKDLTDKNERKNFAFNFMDDLIDILLTKKVNVELLEVNADYYYKIKNSKFLINSKCNRIIMRNSLLDFDAAMELFKKSKTFKELNIGVDIYKNSEISQIYNSLRFETLSNINICFYLNQTFNGLDLESLSKSKDDEAKINNLKITFINSQSFFQNESFNKETIQIISSEIYDFLQPKYLEIKTVEIYPAKEGMSLFKVNKIYLSKKAFLLSNLINLSIKRVLKKLKNEDFKRLELIQKTISNNVLKMYGSRFEIKDFPLPLKLNKEYFEKNPKFKRYISNLYMDFKSVMIRKETYETILFRMYNINAEPEISLRLIKKDCNTMSKILQKIEGNNIMSLPDGKIVSIGGCLKMKGFKDNNSLNDLACINKILIFNEELSNLTIISPKINELLPHYNAKCFAIVNKDVYKNKDFSSSFRLILSGGISNSEYIQNFIGIPILQITLSKNSLSLTNENELESMVKINKIEIGDIANSCLFSHKVYYDNENRSLVLYDGFLFNHQDNKGFQIMSLDPNPMSTLDKKSSVKENSQKYTVDIYN